MNYKVRQGIVCMQICGADMLVASRPVWEYCPHVQPIPAFWAKCWVMLEKGYSSDELIGAFVRLLNRSEEEVRPRLEKIFRSLSDKGFLIAVGDVAEGDGSKE